MRKPYRKSENGDSGHWEINPKCGKAYTVLGAHLIFSPNVDHAQGLELGLKAVIYGPSDPMNHLSFGFGITNGGLKSPTLVAYKQAHTLDPLYAYAANAMAEGLYILGRYAEAWRWVNQTFEI